MKKFLLTLLTIAITAIPCFATTYDPVSKVPTVGENLLTKNGIPATNVKFMVVSGNVDNSNFVSNKVVNVSSNDLAYTGNDNEVASVVANELGHIISGHASKGKVADLLKSASGVNLNTNETTSSLVANYTASKEEKEADIVAIDLMVTAGYNPLALIVVLTKQTGTYWETLQGKPANADRALSAYDYISYAYPDKIKAGYGCNEYRNFVSYATPVVGERNKKAQTKLEKELAKSKKNSTSQITKFKTRGGLSGWDAALELLNGAQ